MFKKSKVVMLPNEKATIDQLPVGIVKITESFKGIQWYEKDSIYFNKNGGYFPESVKKYYQPQYLYILSDEEIKEGDWMFHLPTNKISGQAPQSYGNSYDYKKIISSTNPSLKLPSPSDSFIKKYCELGGIDEVLLEYVDNGYEVDMEGVGGEDIGWCHKYELKVAPDNTITIRKVKENYNINEVHTYLHKLTQELKDSLKNNEDRLKIQEVSNKWIEENLGT